MRTGWLRVVVAATVGLTVGLGAAACERKDAPAPASRPRDAAPIALAPDVVAAIVPAATLDRLARLAPPALGGALSDCAGLLDAPRGELAPATVAAATTATGARAVADALGRAADAIDRRAPADEELAQGGRELGASLRDLGAAFGELAAAIAAGDAGAARALGGRIDNGVGNAEASVAKLVMRCSD